MLLNLVLCLGLSALAVAIPTLDRRLNGFLPWGGHGPVVTPGIGQLQQPAWQAALPVHGNGIELPAPPASVALKYIAIGHGIQNYTCASANPSAAPVSTGALAVLYDATFAYSFSPSPSAQVATVANMAQPINLDKAATAGLVSASHPGASASQPFLPDAPITVNGHELPVLGRHYSGAAGTPIFNLFGSAIKLLLNGTVANKIAAPTTASAGPDGQAAVPWLQIQNGGGSVGLSYAYRVLTVGGSALNCTAAGAESVPYAAFYFFYGPRDVTNLK